MALSTERNTDNDPSPATIAPPTPDWRPIFDSEQHASKLDEIAAKLPNLVGDQNALVAYGADLRAQAERIRNPRPDYARNPAGQPDIRPDFKTLHEDGQSAAERPKVRLENDANAPDLPIAVPDPASVAAIEAQHGKKVEATQNQPDAVAARTEYGTGSDTQKGAGKPGKL